MLRETLALLTALMTAVVTLLAEVEVDKTSFEYRFDESLKQTPDSIERNEKWFYDAKFGAFIHFGIYSVLEGAYKGKAKGPKYAEWIWADAKISL